MQARQNEPKWVKFAAGAFAGSASEVATAPFEVLKTRLQLATGTMCARGRNMEVITMVYRNEGLAALYKGVTPGVARQVVYCGGKLNVYEPVRALYADLLGPGSMAGSLLAGGTAGALANFLSTPADLMKVRFQADPTGAFSRRGLLRCWADCVREEGAASLWRGCGPTVMRAFAINSVELGGYDITKRTLAPYFTAYSRDDVRLHLVCGAISGVTASIASLPFDVIKSRMMVSGSQFTSIRECVAVTLAREGAGAFFKGFVPVASRIVPFNIIQFTLFEQARRTLCGEYF
jgi:solute carrier family 25 uncoupling protein 8/9